MRHAGANALGQLSELLQKLRHRAELVERVRCETDRRVIYVALTDKGGKTVAAIDEPLVAFHREVLGHFTQAELKQLITLLAKVRERLADET